MPRETFPFGFGTRSKDEVPIGCALPRDQKRQVNITNILFIILTTTIMTLRGLHKLLLCRIDRTKNKQNSVAAVAAFFFYSCIVVFFSSFFQQIQNFWATYFENLWLFDFFDTKIEEKLPKIGITTFLKVVSIQKVETSESVMGIANENNNTRARAGKVV